MVGRPLTVTLDGQEADDGVTFDPFGIILILIGGREGRGAIV
jgi:hypothetical protein